MDGRLPDTIYSRSRHEWYISCGSAKDKDLQLTKPRKSPKISTVTTIIIMSDNGYYVNFYQKGNYLLNKISCFKFYFMFE